MDDHEIFKTTNEAIHGCDLSHEWSYSASSYSKNDSFYSNMSNQISNGKSIIPPGIKHKNSSGLHLGSRQVTIVQMSKCGPRLCLKQVSALRTYEYRRLFTTDTLRKELIRSMIRSKIPITRLQSADTCIHGDERCSYLLRSSISSTREDSIFNFLKM